jgi:hypothetical protein
VSNPFYKYFFAVLNFIVADPGCLSRIRVVDPYSFFPDPDPDPDYDVGD